jgi:hypothetical protein
MILFAAASVTTFAAEAQTTAPGPYYAMPSWDQTLPANTRFIVLSNMNNEAVLDRETGLVWEQSPSAFPADWSTAFNRCIVLRKGGRFGWRLPAIQELASLLDETAVNPALPSGHPFSNVVLRSSHDEPLAYFWSTTTNAVFGVKWFAGFLHALVGIDNPNDFSPFARPWCVRGGPGGLDAP